MHSHDVGEAYRLALVSDVRGHGPSAVFTAFSDLSAFTAKPIAPLPQRPTVVFVGSLEPYKNIAGLGEAPFEIVHKRRCGGPAWSNRAVAISWRATGADPRRIRAMPTTPEAPVLPAYGRASLGEVMPLVRHVHRKIFLPTYGLFDEERFVEAIREDLAWLGLMIDGEARQSQRLALSDAQSAFEETGVVAALQLAGLRSVQRVSRHMLGMRDEAARDEIRAGLVKAKHRKGVAMRA